MSPPIIIRRSEALPCGCMIATLIINGFILSKNVMFCNEHQVSV